jgi:hypothetical protein
LYIFAPVKTQTAMQTLTKNTYVAAESNIKNNCRALIIAEVFKKFPISIDHAKKRKLRTFTLGGEDLKLENLLDRFYSLNGVSFEFNVNSVEKARKNAPVGIEIIHDNIFNGEIATIKPNLIWFDFMTSLRYENIQHLLLWLQDNPIVNECVFVVTYTLHSRAIKGEGYRQLFESEDEHNAFIADMANYIGLYLENNIVELEKEVIITRYCNVDIHKNSYPMVQFIFNLKKR